MGDEELLGRAVLELSTDDRRLEAGLASAERRVAISTAAMQAMLDKSSRQAGGSLGTVGSQIDRQLVPPIGRLSAASEQMGTRVDASLAAVRSNVSQTRSELDGVHRSLIEISRTIPPSAQLAALSAARETPGVSVARGMAGQVVGVRGASAPGSIQNPMVVVLEAGKYTNMGALAAALGQADTGSSSQAQRVLAAAPGGSSAQPFSGPAGSSTVSIDAGQYAGLISAIVQSGNTSAVVPAVGGSGGGGGAVPPVALGAGGGGGPGILRRLGWGAGFAGAAGFGSALSFAGLDFGHLLTTGLGIVGSAAGAAGGAGLLGLGSLGKLAVGGGSDLAVMKSTIADVQTLYKAYGNVTQAQAIYGNGSRQAAVAQAQLNYQMSQLGPAAGAELALAKQADQLNTMWDKLTVGARVNAVAILAQVLALGTSYVPRVAAAAQLNLGIVNAGLKPLFQWLEGPQGIQIWNDLENKFAHDLPTAVHAFDQGIELLGRITDLASAHTGGFIGSLDHLLTRLNALDSATLGQTVDRYIADFRLWERFVKLLIADVYLLFHQDVGTGNAIISTLDGMLGRLHAYETSARGSAQIQSIFMVHKTEVLELIHILGTLGGTFARVYMAIAPTAVTAMNDVVLPVFKALGGALSFIAHTSPIAADALGILLLSFKAFGAGGTLMALKSFFGWFTGAEVANAGAANADAAAQARLAAVSKLAGGGKLSAAEQAAAGGGAAGLGGRAGQILSRVPRAVESGALSLGGALETAGASGAGMAVVGAGGSIAAGLGAAGAAVTAALPVVLPLAVAGVGAYFLAHDVLGVGSTPKVTATPWNVSGGTPGGKFTYGTMPGTGFAAGDILNVKKIGDFANYSQVQLAALVAEMKQAGGLQLNGIDVPKKQLIALAQAALKAKTAWNDTFNQAWQAVNTFYRNTSRTLPALRDDFDSNMRLIAHTMGLNSTIGRQLVAQNVSKMVTAVSAGMLSGRVSVTQGMAAIKDALGRGMSDNAITWGTQWRAMFKTVTDLYAHHKIDSRTFLSDLRQINQTAVSHIRSDTEASYQKTFQSLKKQFDDGLLTKQQFDQKVHDAQLAANTQERKDLGKYAGNVLAAMYASGGATLAGAQAVVKELNQVLVPLGAAKIPMPTLVGVQVSNAVGQAGTQAASAISQLFATGGLMQVGQPGQAGRDTVPLDVGAQRIMVAPGERLAVFNRHQWPEINARLAGEGGLPGFFANRRRPHYMASGGIVTASEFGGPSDPGTGSVGYRGDNLYQHPDSYAELSMGTALGSLPYLTPLDVTYAGHTARLRKRDIGAGGPGLHGHARALDLWFEAAQALGLPGLADVLVGGAAGVNVRISGSGQVQSISAPRVKGSGAMAHIVQASLDKLAAAAGAYVAARTPSVNATVGVGGIPFRHGKFTFPLPAGSWQAGAVDQGWDLSAAGHTPELALGAGTIAGHGISGFGPWAPILRLADGTEVYYGHAGPGGELPVGTHVSAGQVLGEVGAGIVGISRGPHLEIGFYPPGGPGAGAAMKSALGYARGGLPGLARAARPKVKAPKHHKPSKPKATGRFKPLPGFDQTLLSQIASSEANVSDLGSWQSYLDSLHSSTGSVQALVTLADGSQVVNWAGMSDPQSGQWAKGISERLAEIGDPGSDPNATATREKMTELGVDEQLLDAYLKEQGMAAQVSGRFTPWLQKMKADLAAKLRKQRNAAALIAYLTKRRERLGPERTARDEQITRRFEIARHQVSSASASGRFQASQLTSAQLAALSAEQRDALAGIPARPPASFLGDTGGWYQARQFERAAIGDEFAARKLAVQTAAAQHRFAGTQSRSGALFGLTLEEQADKAAVARAFDQRRISVDDKLRLDRAAQTLAGKYVTSDQTALSAATGSKTGALDASTWSGSFYDTLRGYIDPMGALAINRLTKETIDIPGLLREIAQLKGTVPLTATTATSDQSALIALLTQRQTDTAQALAVSEAQYKVLAALPPYAGSFAAGGVVPGPVGMPRTIIAHGGEEYSGVGKTLADRLQVIVLDGAVDPNKIRVIANGEAVRVSRQQAVGAGRALPGAGGGLLRG